MNLMIVYFRYLEKCKHDNTFNLRDPNHDYMEWNHTFPQCLFKGHGPGQWLTFEQHAIASALQTLAFDTNCLYGSHLPLLPQVLRDLVREVRNRTLFTYEHQSKAGKKGGKAGLGVPKNFTPEDLADRPRRLQLARDARTPEGLAKGGKAAGPKNGKTVMSYRYQCTVTGFITTAPALARYQKARGIDPSNRIKIN
jgi:hypothetical protein